MECKHLHAGTFVFSYIINVSRQKKNMKTQKDIIIDVIRGNPSQLSSYMKIKNYLNELRYVLCDAVHEKNLIIKQEAIFLIGALSRRL